MADFATIVVNRDIPIGQTEHLYIGTCVGPTYATGGNLFDPSGNTRLEWLDVKMPGYVAVFVPASQLVKLYYDTNPAAAGGANTALVEVTNAADLSAVVGVWLGIGA